MARRTKKQLVRKQMKGKRANESVSLSVLTKAFAVTRRERKKLQEKDADYVWQGGLMIK